MRGKENENGKTKQVTHTQNKKLKKNHNGLGLFARQAYLIPNSKSQKQ